MNKTCGNCRFAKVNPQDVSKRFCTGLPPTPIAIPTPKGIAVQQIYPMREIGDAECALYRPSFKMPAQEVVPVLGPSVVTP